MVLCTTWRIFFSTTRSSGTRFWRGPVEMQHQCGIRFRAGSPATGRQRPHASTHRMRVYLYRPCGHLPYNEIDNHCSKSLRPIPTYGQGKNWMEFFMRPEAEMGKVAPEPPVDAKEKDWDSSRQLTFLQYPIHQSVTLPVSSDIFPTISLDPAGPCRFQFCQNVFGINSQYINWVSTAQCISCQWARRLSIFWWSFISWKDPRRPQLAIEKSLKLIYAPELSWKYMIAIHHKQFRSTLEHRSLTGRYQSSKDGSCQGAWHRQCAQGFGSSALPDPEQNAWFDILFNHCSVDSWASLFTASATGPLFA